MKQILALLLPIVGLSVSIAKVELSKVNATTWVVPIQGYDPRDLLKGQYIQFSFSWAQDSNMKNSCLCFRESAAGVRVDPVVTQVACADVGAASCDAVAEYPGPGPFRFYVDESKAKEWEQRLQNEEIRLRISVSPDRSIYYEELVGSEP